MMLTPQTDLAVAQVLLALREERDRAVKYAEAAPHPGSAPWKEMRAVYAERDRLRAALCEIVRKLNAESYSNEEGVDPVDILDIAKQALGDDKP